jgi:DNA-directed RNA polymerase subunit RPC12/RpoP
MIYSYRCHHCGKEVDWDRPNVRGIRCPVCKRLMIRVWNAQIKETSKFSTKTRRGNEQE